MPIIFITLSDTFTEKIKEYGFEAMNMRIQDYIPNPNRKTYYVSPANSLCYMDGGIDYALSRIVFPDVEVEVKIIVKELNITNIIGRRYLPIGSSIVIDNWKDSVNKSLVVSPTMLLPQNVSTTKNAYYATMSVLYNILINKKEKMDNVDILFTSFCCGYGKMSEDTSICQILEGIANYKDYKPIIINKNIIINEPNLYEQPKYYQNTEWFSLKPEEIIKC
jgi:O-acetyl-ADP-ribose deacetylase (regulator of RNase III)